MPLAEVERELMRAFVAGAGENLSDLQARTDPKARELLAAASCFASDKLCEIEARWRYLHVLHHGV
jgi:hypothetical protein